MFSRITISNDKFFWRNCTVFVLDVKQYFNHFQFTSSMIYHQSGYLLQWFQFSSYICLWLFMLSSKIETGTWSTYHSRWSLMLFGFVVYSGCHSVPSHWKHYHMFFQLIWKLEHKAILGKILQPIYEMSILPYHYSFYLTR